MDTNNYYVLHTTYVLWAIRNHQPISMQCYQPVTYIPGAVVATSLATAAREKAV